MGLIINIDEALNNRADYNIFREPINDMLKARQEAWEQKNPIDLLFKRGTINKFAELYTDSIGFAHAFQETGDYNVAPIFNTEEGFSTVYTSRTFQGGFIITQQVLEDGEYNKVKDTANKFMTRWHGDEVEYAMTAIGSGFGVEKTFGEGDSVTRLKLVTADTLNGDVTTPNKQALFSKKHYMVKRRGMTTVPTQANLYCITDSTGTTYGIDLLGDDPGKIAKLADAINYVITEMENYKDDNGKFAGVSGAKTIVCPNDARLVAALNAALSMDMFNGAPNPAYQRATVEATPYLRALSQCYDATNGKGVGFFIVDKEYNAGNHGPEFTERVALTLNVEQKKNPYGIAYDARQRFDINVASWRGISFVYIGSTADATQFQGYDSSHYTADASLDGLDACQPIAVIDTIVKPVSVVGTVYTDDAT